MIHDCENLVRLVENDNDCIFRRGYCLELLEICNCPNLNSLSNNNLPSTLKSLMISNCADLRCLLEEGKNVNISSACHLQHLTIMNCPSLVSLSPRGELPLSLKQLSLSYCPKLESIAQEIQDNSSLEFIRIDHWCNIIYLPQGLNKVNHLWEMCISGCSNLVSFPEDGLPTSNLIVLNIGCCEKLHTLPNGIHNLNNLEELEITNCSSMTSFPEEGIPPSLRKLTIEGPNICEPLIKCGLPRLTSLHYLSISNGCLDATLFPQEEIGMMLPRSLTNRRLFDFPKLKALSSKGFQDLTSLEYLYIADCPNLESLPEKDKLLSLLELDICNCPMLKERCEKNKRPEWSKIAHIPYARIDNKYFYDSS
ncbi:hypothetical protein DITRI_Ditri09bG0058300 [Diplodiscus trichospermus]